MAKAGETEARPEIFGDVVIARKDTPTSYHLAVTVDDGIQGVSLVTREEVGMGQHVASWNGLADRGEPVASGVYFARLVVDGSTAMVRKLVLLK